MDSGQTATYYYDSLNQRVRIQPTRGTYEFVWDIFGRRVSNWAASSHSFVEANGYTDAGPIAIRTAGSTQFEHQNWLGTERLRTSYNGAVLISIASLPWGDGHTPSGDSGDQHDFALMDRDLEDNTEHAQFRQYSTNLGRWQSPDPYLGSYDLTNPQTFNRYTYALNDPANLLDPSGLDTTQPVPCLDQYGNPIYCMSTVNGNGGDGGDILCWWCTEYSGSPSPYPIMGRDPIAPPFTATLSAPNKGTFTKTYLPPGAQSCSAILNFNAPPGFDLNAIIAAGRAGGSNPFAALRAVGHNGTFDFQRSSSGGNTTFFSGYTDASNIAVGAYLYGAGFSNGQASFIANSFASTMSSNAGSPQQSDYRNLGYDLAAAGWNPSCH